jgi:hypothetical protein
MAGVLAQTPSPAACSLEKGYYHCDQAAFARTLKAAWTVAVESRPINLAANKSLRDLVRALNKTETSEAPDLTFVLIKAPDTGINFGPGDRELASLRIYSRGPNGERGQLIWVETLDGQPDMPWPTVVYDLIQQFKASIK